MNLAALEHLPDDVSVTVTLKVGELRRALLKENPDRDLSTTEASDEFGHSVEWWSRRAEMVPGAWQERDGTPWYLPRSGCRAYLASLKSQSTRRGKRGLRGPNQSNASSASARPAGFSERALLRGRSQAVAGGAPHTQEPIGPRLAP